VQFSELLKISDLDFDLGSAGQDHISMRKDYQNARPCDHHSLQQYGNMAT